MDEGIDIKTIIPKPTPGLLLKIGRDKYYEIAEMLYMEGKWKTGDEIALLALCVSYQRWVQAEKQIRKHKSLTFGTDSGYRQQIPEISIANNAMKQMLSFIKEFGLTPKERAQIEAVVTENNIDPELESMISK